MRTKALIMAILFILSIPFVILTIPFYKEKK